jgi:hypothetical protein
MGLATVMIQNHWQLSKQQNAILHRDDVYEVFDSDMEVWWSYPGRYGPHAVIEAFSLQRDLDKRVLECYLFEFTHNLSMMRSKRFKDPHKLKLHQEKMARLVSALAIIKKHIAFLEKEKNNSNSSRGKAPRFEAFLNLNHELWHPEYRRRRIAFLVDEIPRLEQLQLLEGPVDWRVHEIWTREKELAELNKEVARAAMSPERRLTEEALELAIARSAAADADLKRSLDATGQAFGNLFGGVGEFLVGAMIGFAMTSRKD